MQNRQLEQLVLESKKDKQKMNDLLETYKPFIMSCTQKVSGKFLRYGSDDELSIAMMAFVLAVERYIPEKGDFLSFAKTIIRSKVIDYYRSQKKHSDKVVYLRQEDDELQENVIENRVSMIVYSEEKTREDRLLEIQLLKDTLARFNISFFELESVAPKNKKTKQICRDVILHIINNRILMNEILHQKTLPLVQIEKELGIRRKKFERHRKYIITILIIKTGDFPYLTEYVKDL